MRLTFRTGERPGTSIDVVGELRVGRADDNGLVINDARVSGQHALLSNVPSGWFVTDLASTNGTLVNGARIPAHQPVSLRPGDVVTFGSHELVADAVPGAAAATVYTGAAQPPPSPGAPVGPPPGYQAPSGYPPPAPGFGPPPGYSPSPGFGTPVAPSGPSGPAWGAPPPVGGGFGLLQLVVRTGPDAGRSTPLGEGGEVEIGRASNLAMPLTDNRISGRHAAVRRAQGRVYVRDLGSSNGTFVDGQAVSSERELRPGGELQVGDTVLVVSDGSALAEVGPSPTVLVSSAPRSERAARRSRRTGVLLGLVALLAAGGAAAFVTLRGSDSSFSPQKVAEGAAPGTVYILVGNSTTELVSSGSGVVIDAGRGLILTNNHVATGGNIWITNEILKERTAARLVAAFPCDDVALLQIDDAPTRAKLKAIAIADPKTVTQGEAVVALGYPGTAATARIPDNATRILTDGVVSQPDTTFDVPGLGSIPVIQHTATINPGNSGGPLLDGSGHLLGLNTFSFNDDNGRRLEGQNYSVAGKRILEILPDLQAGRAVKWLGMQLGNPFVVGNELIGLQVTRIHPGSPISAVRLPNEFYRDGLPMIVAIDGKPVRTEEEYCKVLPNDVGGTVKVTFAPLGDPTVTQTVEVKVGRS